MSFFTDLALSAISHLPKIFNWWLYNPDKTKQRIEVDVSAQEGSVEVWCNKDQVKFKIYIQFKNNNPFPIEIDRSEVFGNLHAAQLKASNLFGLKLGKGKSDSLLLEGKIDDINLTKVNDSPDNESMRIEIKAIILNKYHIIRDFRIPIDRLMCKLINKNI